MGDLYAQVTLREAMADKLIIGGLPKSRLPLILGLLGLTAALIGTALLQLRRESQLTRLRSDFISGVRTSSARRSHRSGCSPKR